MDTSSPSKAPAAPGHKYTVLLLRPDYIASQYGEDTYLAHVVAASAGLAGEKAQMEAWVTDNGGPDECDDDASGDPDDYNVLFTALGHLDDLSVGETSEGETRACPACGEDGGTSCGAINCEY
jgi:hypothetical protein